MQNKASTVGAYIKELPKGRRQIVSAMTALCKKTLVGFDEGVEYGMPFYKKGGVASRTGYV